jgi:cell division protein FtsZ
VIDDSMGDEVRVTVIATGFDHGGPQPTQARETTRRARRDRDVTMDDRQRSSLEISDDEIDIPSFLKDR